jgi:hypothetical protein
VGTDHRAIEPSSQAMTMHTRTHEQGDLTHTTEKCVY